jgi:hypothetical protein
MTNLVATVVKTALRVPVTILGEARKLAGRVLGRGELSDLEVEQAQEEIQAGIRDQARASIETVRVAEEIREKTVTADNTPI